MHNVEFVTMNTHSTRYDDTESYQLRRDRPLPWLQMAALWLLKKLGAYRIGELVTVERHTIDAPTFMDRVFAQRAELQKSFNVCPSRLLIGSEDYAEMMQETAANQAFSFSAKYGYNREIMGLKVEVIPWMRGMLVMPSNDQGNGPREA